MKTLTLSLKRQWWHIRNTLLGYLFRVFRAALNASM